jgi:uncharacterized protein (TIGR04255 family)
MARRIYPRPPIVEAIIEFHFAKEVGKDVLLRILENKLGDAYGGKQRHQHVFEIEATLNQPDVAPKTRRSTPITFLRSHDELRVLGCADAALTVHVLAPYPGWERFLEQADEARNALISQLADVPLKALGVRYIDRIELPLEGVDSLNDYLTILPPKPQSMPPVLTDYAFQIVTQDEDGATIGTMRCNIAVSPQVVISLDVSMTFQTQDQIFGTESWKDIVDRLHSRQRDMFEEAMTDRTRGLFQ